MEDPSLSVETRQNVSLLRLNDGKANALSPKLIGEVHAALDEAEKRGDAVVITGRPGRFSAGFDMKIMMSGIDQATALVSLGAKMFLRLYSFPRPVVVACSGHALAGGALLVLIGDLRLCAAGDFKIGLNEVSIGLPLPILGQELARDRLTSTELTAATLFAKIYDPAGAKLAGYIDEVVPEAELLERAHQDAVRLGALSPPAYAATKQRLRRQTIATIEATLADDMKSLLFSAGG